MSRTDVQVHDVVRLTDDHDGVVTRGELWCVLDLSESPVYGPVASLGRIEHLPGASYPRGQWAHLRVVPVAWLKVDENRSETWKAVRYDEPQGAQDPEAG